LPEDVEMQVTPSWWEFRKANLDWKHRLRCLRVYLSISVSEKYRKWYSVPSVTLTRASANG
jgi:hypothetical protein